MIYWLQVNVAVHCLSTDFSNQKGVKVCNTAIVNQVTFSIDDHTGKQNKKSIFCLKLLKVRNIINKINVSIFMK
jgi:hypothetical protein